MKQSKNGSVK